MNRYTKLYEINHNDGNFFVRENCPNEPLLLLTFGPYSHLYHIRGFEWDTVLRKNLGDEMSRKIISRFAECEQYLKTNPEPWKDDKNIKVHKEHW